MSMLFFYLTVALALSFLCSILEAVLLSTTHSYIHSLRKQNPDAGAAVKYVKDNLDTSIAAILTMNTFAHTIGAAGVGAESAKIFGDEYLVITSIILTLLILYVSEIFPKTLGAKYWKPLAPTVARIIKFSIIITYPFIVIAKLINKMISKEGGSDSISREEIIAVTELGEKSGSVREKEVDLIENLLSLADDRVRDILTPRSVVFALQQDSTVSDAVKHSEFYSRSRIPVYDKNIDDVVGMVFGKKIMEEVILEREDTKIGDIKIPIFRVSENIPVLKVLDMFIQRKEHMFLVVDSYGQTAGVVTLEDAIEQLLDVDIMDEFDQVEDMQEFAKRQMRLKDQKKQNGNNQ